MPRQQMGASQKRAWKTSLRRMSPKRLATDEGERKCHSLKIKLFTASRQTFVSAPSAGAPQHQVKVISDAWCSFF